MARKLALAAANLAAVLVLFILVEGLATGIFYLAERSRRDEAGGPSHTMPDSLLGWINVPDLSLPSFYGPGIGVRINSQGFRNAESFAVKIPPNKVRLICVGDSFTFGQGVGDDHSWPARVAAVDDRFEVVNMGQPGYGVDQAYLWYKRDGLRLEHDIAIFAFITWDFYRMTSRTFQGLAKPYLILEDDSLVVTNVPIAARSRDSFTWRRFAPSELRSIQLAHKLIARARPRPADPTDAGDGLEEVAAALLADLNETTRSRGVRLVLVHLPILEDANLDRPKTNAWRAFLANLSDSLEIEYVDLVDAMRQMSAENIPTLFLSDPGNPAAGHFSDEGNRVFAEALRARILTFPEVERKLGLSEHDAQVHR